MTDSNFTKSKVRKELSRPGSSDSDAGLSDMEKYLFDEIKKKTGKEVDFTKPQGGLTYNEYTFVLDDKLRRLLSRSLNRRDIELIKSNAGIGTTQPDEKEKLTFVNKDKTKFLKIVDGKLTSGSILPESNVGIGTTNIDVDDKKTDPLKWDAHEQIVLSPQCIIESNNPNPTFSGSKAFAINTCNHDDVRFNVTHYDGSDLTKVESEGILEVDSGIKANKEGTSLQVVSHHGNIAINAEDGSILIKSDGKSIVLDADNIILKGRRLIQIGDNTQEVKIIGNKIDAIGKSGNIPTVLSQHLLSKSFLGSAFKGTAFAGQSSKHPVFWVS